MNVPVLGANGQLARNTTEFFLDRSDVRLTADDIQEIEDGFAAIGVDGARAPEELLARHDVGANLGTSSRGGHGMSPLPEQLPEE